MRRWSGMAVMAATLVAVPGARAQEPVDATDAEPRTEYAADAEYPFGRPNPEAPPEITQFDFMIGTFDCIDTVLRPAGTRVRFRAIWEARYFLNGMGILDEYWSPQNSTSNIRIFDSASGSWKVTFFKKPGYVSSRWEGKKDGDRMVMRPEGNPEGSPLIFSEITYEWQAGVTNPGWTSSCTRRES